MRYINLKGTIAGLMLAVITFGGCQKAATPAANSTPAANQIATTDAVVSTDHFELSSPTAAYQTAFEARKRCDLPVLKRVMSQAMLASIENLGKDNPGGAKSLDEMLKQLCEMPEAPNAGEIKDEKVIGDEGTLKFKDEKGAWQLMDFVREEGEWKLTLPRGKSELPALK